MLYLKYNLVKIIASDTHRLMDLFLTENICFILRFIDDYVNTYWKKVIIRSFKNPCDSCVSHSLDAVPFPWIYLTLFHFLGSTWYCSISLDCLMLFHLLGLSDAAAFPCIYLMLFHFFGLAGAIAIPCTYLILFHFLGLPDAVPFLWIISCCSISLYLPDAVAVLYTYLMLLQFFVLT